MINNEFLNTKNKIKGLNLIIQQYEFLTQEVIKRSEYFKFRLTQEAQQRELELFKLSGIEKSISDFKEDDLEQCFLWTDEESKKEYLSGVRYNIEQSLKSSISYAVKLNIETDIHSDSFFMLKDNYNTLLQINDLVKKELVKLKYDYKLFYRESLELYGSYDPVLTEQQKEFKRHLVNELKEVEVKELVQVDKKELKPIPKSALHIFENKKGYNLFLEMHEIYKDKVSVHLSNYSFLYHALLKKNFIAYSNKNFINYLAEEFDIGINKIDSRQKDKHDNRQLLFDNLLGSL